MKTLDIQFHTANVHKMNETKKTGIHLGIDAR